jgi:hypothetical protein
MSPFGAVGVEHLRVLAPTVLADDVARRVQALRSLGGQVQAFDPGSVAEPAERPSSRPGGPRPDAHQWLHEVALRFTVWN